MNSILKYFYTFIFIIEKTYSYPQNSNGSLSYSTTVDTLKTVYFLLHLAIFNIKS